MEKQNNPTAEELNRWGAEREEWTDVHAMEISDAWLWGIPPGGKESVEAPTYTGADDLSAAWRVAERVLGEVPNVEFSEGEYDYDTERADYICEISGDYRSAATTPAHALMLALYRAKAE